MIAEAEASVQKLKSDLGEVKTAQRQLQLELNELSLKANGARNTGPTASASSLPNQPPNSASVFSLLRSDDLHIADSEISIADALKRFQSVCHPTEADESFTKAFFYLALFSNCLILNESIPFTLWQRSMGWHRSRGIACASAMWVDETFLADHLTWLLSEPQEPRVLNILDFDLGFTNGYLVPFLKAWYNSAKNPPWKKIALLPSTESWKVEPGLELVSTVLPQIPSEFIGHSKTLWNDIVPADDVILFIDQLSSKNLESEGASDRPRDDASRLYQASAIEERFCQANLISRLPLSVDIRDDLSALMNIFWARRLDL